MTQFFNQDATCVTHVSNDATSFGIFQCNPFKLCSKKMISNLKQVKMLYRCNILIYLDNSLKTIYLWDDKQSKTIGYIKFTQEIKNYYISQKYIYCVFLNQIMLYDLKTLDLIQKLTTIDNVIFAQNDDDFLIYNSQKNLIQTPDLEFKCFEENEIKEITNIAVNDASDLICVIGDGIFIRIFNQFGALVREFRRGMNSEIITCMKFNITSTMLAIASQSGTIHIFSLISENTKSNFHFLANLLQTNYLKSEWSKNKIFLPKGNTQFAFGFDDCLYITNNNQFYKYELNPIINMVFTWNIQEHYDNHLLTI